jgi:S-adenosylmethionine/arginine decarboxylase-like enzyme
MCMPLLCRRVYNIGILKMEHQHLMVMARFVELPETKTKMINAISSLVDNLGMKLLIPVQTAYCSTEGNSGWTVICAIETSHIVLHTWDEEFPMKMQLDVYTCSKLDLSVVWRWLEENFMAAGIVYKFYDRKKGFTLLKELVAPWDGIEVEF